MDWIPNCLHVSTLAMLYSFFKATFFSAPSTSTSVFCNKNLRKIFGTAKQSDVKSLACLGWERNFEDELKDDYLRNMPPIELTDIIYCNLSPNSWPFSAVVDDEINFIYIYEGCVRKWGHISKWLRSEMTEYKLDSVWFYVIFWTFGLYIWLILDYIFFSLFERLLEIILIDQINVFLFPAIGRTMIVI